jgi:hypothetical protein
MVTSSADHITEIETADIMLAILEKRIRQVIAGRKARLAEYVNIETRDQQFFYVTNDDGYVLTKQDAPFVCESILLIGNSVCSTKATPFAVSIEDLGPGIVNTAGYSPEAYSNTGGTPPINNNITIPIDMFVPCHRRGDVNGWVPANTDYWFNLAAEWIIPKGDTLRVRYTPEPAASGVNGNYTPPLIVLAGYKVFT